MNQSSSQSSSTSAAILGQMWKMLVDYELEPDAARVAVFALACAEHVLPFFQEDFPNDERPGKAIEAARTWLSDTAASRYAVIDPAINDARNAADMANGENAAAAEYAALAACAGAKAARDGSARSACRAAVRAVDAATCAVADNPASLAKAAKAESCWQLGQFRQLFPEIADLDESQISDMICDSIANLLTGGWAVQDAASPCGNGQFEVRARNPRDQTRRDILGFGASALAAMVDLRSKARQRAK